MNVHGRGRGAPDYARHGVGPEGGDPDPAGRGLAAIWCENGLLHRLEGLGLPLRSFGAGVEALVDAVVPLGPQVVQMPGAEGASNRFYTVHPRRNDRFVRPSDDLLALFPSVDFTEFTFVRHMLSHLAARSPASFLIVVRELQASWVMRMRSMGAETVLLRLRRPIGPLGPEPLFVTEEMVGSLECRVIDLPVNPTENDLHILARELSDCLDRMA